MKFLLVVIALFCGLCRADIMYLNNGGKIEGVVTQTDAGYRIVSGGLTAIMPKADVWYVVFKPCCSTECAPKPVCEKPAPKPLRIVRTFDSGYHPVERPMAEREIYLQNPPPRTVDTFHRHPIYCYPRSSRTLTKGDFPRWQRQGENRGYRPYQAKAYRNRYRRDLQNGTCR